MTELTTTSLSNRTFFVILTNSFAENKLTQLVKADRRKLRKIQKREQNWEHCSRKGKERNARQRQPHLITPLFIGRRQGRHTTAICRTSTKELDFFKLLIQIYKMLVVFLSLLELFSTATTAKDLVL